MEERRHIKWLVKKKKVLLRNEPNLNPRASAALVMSNRKESNEGTVFEVEEADELEEQDGNDEDDVQEENLVFQENIDTLHSEPLQINSCWKSKEIKWDG
ncbi:DNA (cytosine-5)-methyltransferase 1B-like [Olea europaea subsp. europaea]|uniref:DNA (Cytosine-5)-methyltransferase 1B-like n=1 Tax=Olea europaea subsp. europaea TaxID=158383 RepID=A0A8S0TXK1_OLEEU|nr:DNA (cytosine-5)-methyltransferase 1B-like [Olea europaea subsp. europaea]